MLIFDSGDPGGDDIIDKVYHYCTQFYKCTYVGSNKDKYSETSVFESLTDNDLRRAKCYIFSSSVKKKSYLKRMRKSILLK